MRRIESDDLSGICLNSLAMMGVEIGRCRIEESNCVLNFRRRKTREKKNARRCMC